MPFSLAFSTLPVIFVRSFTITANVFLETADVDFNNNSWPQEFEPTRYQLFKQQGSKDNPMQRQKKVDALPKN